MFCIGATRFNNFTWNENERWRETKNVKEMYYGFPRTLSLTIPYNSWVFVLEMNNDTNKILGISLIKKGKIEKNICNIYSDRNYNRYIYKTKYRIDVSILNENEKLFIEKMENICFKGKTHIKRGQAVTKIPDKLLIKTKEDNIKIFKLLFIKYFKHLPLLQDTM